MSTLDPLPRWADGPEDETPLARELSRAFQSVPEPQALPDVSRQRVAARLRMPARRGPMLMLIRLVALGVVIGVGSAAAAQWATQRWLTAARQTATEQVRLPVREPPLVPQPSLPRVSRPVLETPEPALVTDARAIGSASASRGPTHSSALGLEAASLEAALTALRSGRPARAAQALYLIDQHLRDFPQGALVLEARVARVDALLLLGRRAEARHELATLPIERVGRKSELRLIRAELLADADCRAALIDFQLLAEQALPGAFAERALFGRGACLLRLGDKEGAERDFRTYLERYPSGRFAAQIRAQR